jgi:hypothetical protein
MTATQRSVPPREPAAAPAPASAAGASPFVLNLCSSTTPMALAQTELPELKRFTFFVSRRFEEGRERFRLHMGYFATLAEAEEWLSVVREIYPGAWAGEAPGRKLRERATAANADQARHAAGPQPRVPAPTPAARGVGTAAVVASAAPQAGSAAPHVPVLRAAQPTARTAPPVVAPAPVAAPPRAKPAPAPAAATPASPAPAARQAPPSPPAAAPSRPSAPPPAARTEVKTPPPAAASRSATGKHSKPVFEDSNVREVLAALGDASATGETRLMKAPPPPAVAAPPPPAESTLSDTQVLRMLETRASESARPGQADVAHGSIPLLKPDDTGTRRALKEAVVSNAPVAFAVQLQWSVQPAELDKVPPLAIFSAYTLYTVEGSRDGRKWYGLRLGFFSDAISAKQVAHYVRSEFASVAVVPVSPQEKARATDQDIQAEALTAAPGAPRTQMSDEFKLIDDDTANLAVKALLEGKPGSAPRAPAAKPDKPAKAAAARPARTPPVPPPGKPRAPRPAAAPPGKVGAREQRAPQTLEETLEILGASELTIDNGNGETLNESGVRHLRVEVHKNSPFSRLLVRLSERMKKP